MTSATIETFRSGDEWVRFAACEGQPNVAIETSDGEQSSVTEIEAAERKSWILRWGYRPAAS
ncbi:hypothetical protein [Sorangium sp. So ce233]|uniref:hypothetical protein n=1 Tax=Sorangium sp. So ce233 TaxID=3133290 RepID=UPI003F5E9E9B